MVLFSQDNCPDKEKDLDPDQDKYGDKQRDLAYHTLVNEEKVDHEDHYICYRQVNYGVGHDELPREKGGNDVDHGVKKSQNHTHYLQNTSPYLSHLGTPTLGKIDQTIDIIPDMKRPSLGLGLLLLNGVQKKCDDRG